MPAPRIIRSASAGLERILDRVLCVAGAVLFSQLPEFMQQYLQRLEGHLDEARLGLDRFKEAAARSGTTLDKLLAAPGRGANPSLEALGGLVRSAVARVDELAAADAALRHASAWTRPFVFASHVDLGIARATWSVFRPAVPTTAEGLLYAGAGMILVLGAYHLGVREPIARRFRRREASAAERCP
ncbi:MAG TPA: DUF2937 family protein [Opitutaceae bacterium]|nr:DUF2937 family protein [Opitutaceae bacterium]